jgi:hypothetical protein
VAQCVKAVQNPDGSLYLTPAPEVQDLSTCQYVLQSGAEVANSLFSLTAADGAELSFAIIGVWLAAFVVRSIIEVIKGSTE